MIVLKALGAVVALALLVFFAIVNHDQRRARRVQRNYERLEFERDGVAPHIIRDPAVMRRNVEEAVNRSGLYGPTENRTLDD